MGKIVNLTPHSITLVRGNNTFIYPPSGTVARVDTTSTLVGYHVIGDEKIPIYKTTFGEITNLPKEKPDTIYLVSLATAQAIAKLYPDRHDILITNEAVRDDYGRVIGCKSFGVV